MQRDFEVVIAGAGLVGAALGIALSDAGLTVALCERAARPVRVQADPRGLALNLHSVAVLRALGVWSALAPQSCPVSHIQVSRRGHFGGLRLSQADLELPVLGYVCPADILQQVLLARLSACAGAQIFWQSEIHTQLPEAEAIQVAWRPLPDAAPATGTPWSGRAALLIGADGTQSSVRARAGLEVTRHDYGQTALVCNVDVSRPARETAFERFTECGPLALLPLGGCRYVMVRTAAQANVDALLRCPDSEWLADAQARFGFRLGTFSQPGPRRAWPLVGQRATQLTAPRMLLVGNAATTVHPNGAQGLNLGLRDVGVVARLLGDAWRDGEDPGSAPVLARIATQRAPDHARIYRLTDALARGFSSGVAPIPALLGFAITVADRWPAFKRRALRTLVLGDAELAATLASPTL